MSNKIRHLLIFSYISYLAMWTIFEVGQIIWLFANHNLTIFHNNDIAGLTDFVPIYIAGKMVSSGQAKELLNPTVYRQFAEALTQCQFNSTALQTPHFFATYLFIAPFTSLSIERAHLLFDLITTLFGLSGLYLLIKELGYNKLSITPLAVLGILASNATWRNWTQGQIMWLFVGFAAFYLYFLFRKQNIIAGILLALSTIKPQYSLFLLVPALGLKRYSLIASAFISELVLCFVCCKVFDFHTLLAYPSILNMYELNSDTVKAFDMNSFRAFLSLILARADAYQIAWLVNMLCLTVLTIIITYIFAKDRNMSTIRWAISTLILASLLFSPHAHIHDTLLLALPVILTLPELNERKTVFLWRWAVYLTPILSWLFFFLSLYGLWGNLFLTTLIAVLFYYALMQTIKQYAKLQNSPLN